jgi:ABC-type transport system involved in cytochrome c biogenesis permease subunit
MNKTSPAKITALLLVLIGAAIVVTGFLPPRPAAGYDLPALAQLPVRFGTRVLPIDSLARNALRLFSGRTSLLVPKGNNPDEKVSLAALPWFLDVAFRPEMAARVPIFRIDNDEVLGLIGKKQKGSQYFSFAELSNHFDDIEKAADAADQKAKMDAPLSLFESEVSHLRGNLQLFQRLTMSFVPPGETPAKDLKIWQESIIPGLAAVDAQTAGQPADDRVLSTFAMQAQLYLSLEKLAIVGLVPTNNANDDWLNLGQSARNSTKTDKIDPILMHYAEMGEALRKDDPAAFNAAVAAQQQLLAGPAGTAKIGFETFMNRLAPYFRGAFLYVLAFLCACVSWIAWGTELRRAAVWLVVMAVVLQTLGLYARVYLTGFGVVTSLYSAMLFNGWIAVMAGLIIELWRKNSIGVAAAAFVGFATLVVATFLPFNGDDLELPRAVLATNFWLWTHVTSINIGCGGMFVAGALGAGYLLARAFAKGLTPERGKEIARLVYGITCFATLFSFVGTMLGGIWADQSWGRFWGWDPKENGALLIVLWCAVCLHARWGKLVSERTQMAMAVVGNMVTAWTLFGVNLLNVGLHTYGFMQGTFYALLAFWASQIFIIVLGYLPPRFWKAKPVAGVTQTQSSN